MMETGYFLFETSATRTSVERRPRRATSAAPAWVRYDDPETKTFKLNVERQNGRAAMLGITGCIRHELLGVDALRLPQADPRRASRWR